jgi:hypothetical protein
MEISRIVIALIHMAFKVVFLAHAPDADPVTHRSVIDTGKYQLYSIVVQNQTQAVNECRKLVEKEGIHSIVLCPGFTHRNIAEIAETVRNKAGVFVARGDGPSSRLTAQVRRREL